MSNTFLKDLNTTLTDSHYPHLTNKLFTNLTLPYGLMVNKQKDFNCTNFKYKFLLFTISLDVEWQ